MLAFDALFYRYRDGIFRLGLAITKDPSHAEEIAVDTFARAHRPLAPVEPEGSLRPWLYRVAVNLSYNRRPRKNVIISPLSNTYERRPAIADEFRSACAYCSPRNKPTPTWKYSSSLRSWLSSS